MGVGGAGKRREGVYRESRFHSSLNLAFLKWFYNQEQERIINRDMYSVLLL